MRTLEDLRKYIQICWQCRHECQSVLFNHCLEMGGKYLESDHVKIMTDCIQICQVAADTMVRQSPLHADLCIACANICEACAESCEEFDGKEMKLCAKVCRKCAQSCQEIYDSTRGLSNSRRNIEDRIMA